MGRVHGRVARLLLCRHSRPDCDFFLWKITERYEDLGELGAELNGTPLAGWLETPYSYLATTKASQYTSARKARKIAPRDQRYLMTLYPFVKVRSWYSLSEEDRRRAMDEHIRIGREEFPGIANHTTYSFGIDDQEFMTAFECDEPADFMHLMLRLRDSEASRYVKCWYGSLDETTSVFVATRTMSVIHVGIACWPALMRSASFRTWCTCTPSVLPHTSQRSNRSLDTSSL